MHVLHFAGDHTAVHRYDVGCFAAHIFFLLEIICSALSKKEKRTSMFILKFDLLFMGNAERKKVVRMDGHLYKQVFP